MREICAIRGLSPLLIAGKRVELKNKQTELYET